MRHRSFASNFLLRVVEVKSLWQPWCDPRSADGEGALFSHAAALGMGGGGPGVFVGAAHSGQVRSGVKRERGVGGVLL